MLAGAELPVKSKRRKAAYRKLGEIMVDGHRVRAILKDGRIWFRRWHHKQVCSITLVEAHRLAWREPTLPGYE